VDSEQVGNAVALALVLVVLVIVGARGLYTSAVSSGERNARSVMRQTEEVRRKSLEGQLRPERSETARLAKELQAATLELQRSDTARSGRRELEHLRSRSRDRQTQLKRLSPSAELMIDPDLDLTKIVELSTQAALSDARSVSQVAVTRGTRGFIVVVELARAYPRNEVFNLRQALSARLPRRIRPEWIQELRLVRPGVRPLALPLGRGARSAAEAGLVAYRETHHTLPPATTRGDARLENEGGLWVKNGLGAPVQATLTGQRATRLKVPSRKSQAMRVKPGTYFVRLDGRGGPWIGWLTFRRGEMQVLDLRE
jgi:Tfp pilus assembly protein PilV